MHNLIVLGCGRSGTSMAAGTFSTAGYWTDKKEWPPDRFNPKGYYEELEIHRINDAILFPAIFSPLQPRGQNHPDTKTAPDFQGWLALLDLDATLTIDESLIPRIYEYVRNQPYCFKDARFSYTINVWKPFLHNTKFVCVFREPALTIQSLVHYCNQREYLRPLQIDRAYAQELWVCIYTHILQKQSLSGDWFFVHYDQFFDDTVLEQLERFAGARFDRTFPDPALRNAAPMTEYNRQVSSIFDELCYRASFTNGTNVDL